MHAADDDQESPLKFFTIVITSEPAPVAGVIGGQAVFTFTYLTNNPALLSFQWQIQTNDLTWNDLVETAGFYEGVTTSTLTVKAIDNYLATRSTLNFRCRVLFSNAVPSFTTPAALTVPIFAGWTPGLGGYGKTTAGTDCYLNEFPTFIVTGFPQPYDYLWEYVSGSANIVPLNSVNPATQFFRAALPAREVAFWRLKLSRFGFGTPSVYTDPLPFVADVGGPSYNGGFTSTFSYTANGAAVPPRVFPPAGPYWIGPYQTAFQQQIRRLSVPTIAMVDPTDQETAFTFSGATPPGTADVISIAGVLNRPQQNPPTDPAFLYYYVPGSSWQR